MKRRLLLFLLLILVCNPLTIGQSTQTEKSLAGVDNAGWIQHPWKDKKVAFIGDSMTDPNNFKGEIRKFWSYLEEWLGIKPYVYGVSGKQWNDVERQANLLNKEHGDDVDAIIVWLGTNEFNSSVPVGQWYTEKDEEVLAARGEAAKNEIRTKRTFIISNETYKGRINAAISLLKKMYPFKQIVLLTPLHRSNAKFGEKNVQPDENYKNRCGEYVDAYVQAIKEAGNLWSVPVIDINALTGMNPMIEEQLEYFHDKSYDRLHLSSKGQERLAQTLMYQLLTLP